MPDFESVKESVSLKEYAESKLKRVHGGLVCPTCSSGTGKSKTPALKIYQDHWHCYACGGNGDIFDLAAIVENLDPTDKKSHLEAVADWANITLNEQSSNRGRRKSTANLTHPKQSEDADQYKRNRELEAQKLNGWRAGFASSPGADYIKKRGFTLEEAKRFGFGYDAFRNRLIIPWKGSDYYHIDRALDNDGNGKYHKPKSDLLGKQPLYNPEALESPAFFVVEGALDALAVEAMGYEAVALGGMGYTDLLAMLNTKRYQGTVLIVPDNDPDEVEEKDKDNSEALTKHEKTIRKAQEFSQNLEAAGIASEILLLDGFNEPEWGTPSGTRIKDTTDMLATDSLREGLRWLLSGAYSHAISQAEERKNEAYAASLARLRVMDSATVVTDLFTLSDEPETIPTGIRGLDNVLDGGLTRSVYVLGALSSLGKTTLSVQIASNIAESGRSVLFVTIEQSAQEIMAKVLSRKMAQQGYTVSTNEIMKSKPRTYWDETKHIALMDVCNRFTEDTAKHFHLLEGITQPTVSDIATVAQTIADHDGVSPVVFIDYLQLLKPMNDRDSDKQATDHNMTALRQMAGRDLKAPVFCISSLNRSSYGTGVTLDAFKESGAIEYGADVLLGLQPKGITDELGESDDKKSKRKADRVVRESKDMLKRECEITILKNRAGRTPKDGIPIMFDVLKSSFVEE